MSGGGRAVAVTGGTGFIGRPLVHALLTAGRPVVLLTRTPGRGPPWPEDADLREVAWDPTGGALDPSALTGVGAGIHLAAETIDGRWTRRKKEAILASRRDGTRLFAETLAALTPRPSVLVCASAVGLYGDRGDEILTETAAPADDFLGGVVQAWEAAAEPARSAGIRTVHLRQGLVLGRHGGALARMLTPFRMGVGGRLGHGRQWMSFCTLDDLVRLYLAALEDDRYEGAVNAVSPHPVTNRTFTRALGAALGRPTPFPLPAAAIGLMFGEMGRTLLLSSQRVVPARASDLGFSFGQTEIDDAFAHVLSKGER